MTVLAGALSMAMTSPRIGSSLKYLTITSLLYGAKGIHGMDSSAMTAVSMDLWSMGERPLVGGARDQSSAHNATLCRGNCPSGRYLLQHPDAQAWVVRPTPARCAGLTGAWPGAPRRWRPSPFR